MPIVRLVLVFVTHEERPKRIKQTLVRHENVNRRVKTFDCVPGAFRNDLSLHRDYFCAAVKIVQISIENGDELPEILQA